METRPQGVLSCFLNTYAGPAYTVYHINISHAPKIFEILATPKIYCTLTLRGKSLKFKETTPKNSSFCDDPQKISTKSSTPININFSDPTRPPQYIYIYIYQNIWTKPPYIWKYQSTSTPTPTHTHPTPTHTPTHTHTHTHTHTLWPSPVVFTHSMLKCKLLYGLCICTGF